MIRNPKVLRDTMKILCDVGIKHLFEMQGDAAEEGADIFDKICACLDKDKLAELKN